MSLKLTILCVALAAPLALAADSRKPEKPERTFPSDRSERPGRHDGDRSGPNWNAEQWAKFQKELAEFCNDVSPNRWKEIAGFKQPGDRARFMGMGMRFHALKALKAEDPKLYEIKVEMIRKEDQEYGLLKEIRKPGADKPALEAKLRSVSREYITLRLADSERRIARLEERLQLEKKQLTEDKKAVDPLVDKRVQDILREGPDFFVPKPPKRMDSDGASTTGPAPRSTSSNVNANP